MGGGDEAGSSEPRTLGWDSNDGGESSEESDGGDGVTAGPIQRGRGLVVEAQRQATHIVDLVAVLSSSALLVSGVFRRVVVDGESFMDALFAAAGQG